MKREEFIHFLKANNWWDANYYYKFTDKRIVLYDKTISNNLDLLELIKSPRKGGMKILSLYKVETLEDGNFKIYIDNISGIVQINGSRFSVIQENGDIMEFSQWIQI